MQWGEPGQGQGLRLLFISHPPQPSCSLFQQVPVISGVITGVRFGAAKRESGRGEVAGSSSTMMRNQDRTQWSGCYWDFSTVLPGSRPAPCQGATAVLHPMLPPCFRACSFHMQHLWRPGHFSSMNCGSLCAVWPHPFLHTCSSRPAPAKAGKGERGYKTAAPRQFLSLGSTSFPCPSRAALLLAPRSELGL